jgi:hypothetical protein
MYCGGGYFSIVLLLSSILFACSGGTNYVGGSSSSGGSSSETTYTITISDSITNGTVTAKIGTTEVTEAKAGEEITLTVSPADGYAPDTLTVKDAGGSDVTVTAYKFTMPAKNVTVSAVFKVATVTYSVTVDGAITGGAVGSDKTTGVSAGETVTLTITRDGGKVLDTLTVKDASNNAVATTAVVAGTSYTFTMPESNVSVTATFKAATLGSKAAPDAVGDIVFNDGSAEAYSDSLTLTTEQIAGAVAVIFDAASKKGVGLRLGTGKWAATGTPGCTTTISTLAATKDGGSGADDAEFSGAGATDGSGSLTTLKTDASITDYNATNYPAWDFVENYATTAGLTGTYENGWYMPSIQELCKLYQVRTDVNSALSKITGATQLPTSGVCWSSSQSASDSDKVWVVNFGAGGFFSHFKYYSSSFFAVRAFND